MNRVTIRIVSGIYKGRILKMPKGIRPTSDKVKEALFDILGEKIIGLRVLDLFAGSGSLGIESLSRGAISAVFIETNKRCIGVIKENLNKLTAYSLQLTEKNRKLSTPTVLEMDVFEAIKLFGLRKQKFDLILLDPPYYKNLVIRTLINISNYDILLPNGLIIAEHYKKDILPIDIEKLKLIRQERYGDTILSFFQKVK